ncbi:MAG: glycosyl transferase, partial [Gammaproteobacteria bacterium]|nr:glycosyl transferase [Gammaproteobacteria bacterium]
RRSVQPLMRLCVHFAAALWAVAWLKGLPPLLLGTQMAHPQWGGYVLAVLGIVWILNLFNFMDGIDGIAASEALFVVLAGAWLTLGGANAKGLALVDLTLAAACGGFLVWNWPPAKIFLGDVGSGYLGYMIAVFALSAGRDDSVALWVWLILGGAFFVDATVTLLRRVARGERVHQAHRSHAYQWLARRWGSHRNVTLAVLAANVVWLLPWAVLAEMFPNLAAGSVLAALVPLALVAAFIGAGRREDGPQGH